MGNCCGKADANFQGEGRALNSRPVDSAHHDGHQGTPKVSSPSAGRTLGKNQQVPNESLSPKEAAARAAEARAAAAQGTSNKGALGQRLNQQKQQSQSATLAQNARDNLAARDADAVTQTRNYN